MNMVAIVKHSIAYLNILQWKCSLTDLRGEKKVSVGDDGYV